MKIKKINDNKLKIFLSINDLDEKNIDVDTFLANPIESQNLFLEILDLVEEKYNFDIENNKAIIEAISLDNNNIFILTITKLKTDIDTAQENNSNIYCFDNTDDILSFYSTLQKNNIKLINHNIYQLGNKYYFLLNDCEQQNFKIFLLEFSSPVHNYSFLKDILIEYANKIKN